MIFKIFKNIIFKILYNVTKIIYNVISKSMPYIKIFTL